MHEWPFGSFWQLLRLFLASFLCIGIFFFLVANSASFATVSYFFILLVSLFFSAFLFWPTGCFVVFELVLASFDISQ